MRPHGARHRAPRGPAAGLADGQGIVGTLVGPKGREIVYTIRCARKVKYGPGPCGVYEIEREGPGAVGLKAKATVGNLYGLVEQLSRDMARSWGCAPGPTSGFEGRRRPRRR